MNQIGKNKGKDDRNPPRESVHKFYMDSGVRIDSEFKVSKKFKFMNKTMNIK